MRRMCALFITLWLSVSVAAQKPKQDPRPLQGQPAERIPEYRPGALSQPAPPAFSSSSPLFDLGTPVGRAERAPLNPRLLGSFRAVFSGTAARRHIELPPRPQAGLELYLSENGTPYWIGFPTPRPVARIQHAEQAFEQARYVDELGIWDIVVADLGQRTGGFLNIPDRNFGGLYIDDAMRPTFSPDDQALAFVSPSNQLLVFYDRRVDQFTIAQSPVPIYNPKWAVDGARLGTGLETEAELPGRTILELYPNPAQETVRIRFRAEVPEGVRLALYDLLGRRIRVLYEGRLPEGVFSWDGRDAQGRPLAAGVYMVRLERSDTGSGILHRRVVWLGR